MMSVKHIAGFIILCPCWGMIENMQPELVVNTTSVSCFGKRDGQIVIEFKDSVSCAFEITVSNPDKKIIVRYTNASLKPYILKNMTYGIYTLTYTDQNAQFDISAEITQPDPLKANIITLKELKGSGTEAIATLQSNASGGNPPYKIAWSENTNSQTGIAAFNLPLGIYSCTITDSQNCGPAIATFFFYEDVIEDYYKSKDKSFKQ